MAKNKKQKELADILSATLETSMDDRIQNLSNSMKKTLDSVLDVHLVLEEQLSGPKESLLILIKLRQIIFVH